jgi:predicted RNA-binding Zn ribbon-like protein
MVTSRAASIETGCPWRTSDTRTLVHHAADAYGMSEPGHREPAPGELRIVQRFVNSADLQEARDELATIEATRRWLLRNHLTDTERPVREWERQELVALREALRDLAAANAGQALPGASAAVLDRAAGRVRLAMRLSRSGRYRLVPEGQGMDRPISEVLVRVLNAMSDGTWMRMKACARPACRWAFYDGSRNRSGIWCSMARCGNREKGATYRARRAGGPQVHAPQVPSAVAAQPA